MKKIAFGLLTLVWLAACTTPNIVVSEDLKSDTEVLEVKGTQGWQINKVIRFGEYHTSKVKKGWTRITNARFITHFKKASQKLNFTQFTPAGDQADVFAIGQFRSNELELLRGWFSYELDYENYFSGSILTHNNEWDFIVFDPEGGTRSADGSFECGEIRSTTGDIIKITGVREIEKQVNWVKLDNFGFEFTYRGRAIAAVSLLNNGRVWIKNDIPEDLKVVVAGVATSLMVRENLQETANNM